MNLIQFLKLSLNNKFIKTNNVYSKMTNYLKLKLKFNTEKISFYKSQEKQI